MRRTTVGLFVMLALSVLTAPVVAAAQHATSTIPIVGVIMGDPVKEGLVASLA